LKSIATKDSITPKDGEYKSIETQRKIVM